MLVVIVVAAVQVKAKLTRAATINCLSLSEFASKLAE